MNDRIVEAAGKAISSIKYCWLATSPAADPVLARPMGRLPRASGDDAWLIRFVTDDRSRKFADIERANRVTVVFQREADQTYVSLFGEAVMQPDAAESPLWRAAYAAYFPAPGDKAHAAFVEIRVDRMEAWIAGVTPEPFGLRPAVLQRDASGAWRSVAA